MKKKLFKSLFLVLVMAVLCMAVAMTASAKTYNGSCGSSLSWSLDTNSGTLTISGSGDMTDYEFSDYTAPWYIYRNNLKRVILPEGITSIGEYAFLACDKLENINLPNSITDIGKNAFHQCYVLNNVVIPDGITRINNHVFFYCESLQNIIIPDSVTYIAKQAFWGCESFTDIVIPNSVRFIGHAAFAFCENLQNITLSNNLTTISDSIFQNCHKLESIIIPESVTLIEKDAFYDCPALIRITLPLSLTTIEDMAFDDCINLKDVYYFGTESDWRKISKGRYNEELTSATIHYNYTSSIINRDYAASKDVWSFKNPTDKISETYWQVFFPNWSTDTLKSAVNASGDGLCYGMSATAITLNAQGEFMGDIINIQGASDFNKEYVSQINKNDISNDLGISALEYIKIMHTVQFHPIICEEEEQNMNDLSKLYDAVKTYEANSSTSRVRGVNIGISGRYFGNSGHSIWGVKTIDYENRSDIVVYDSNHPNEERTLSLYKDENGVFTSWSYKLFDGFIGIGETHWGTNKKNSSITFSTSMETAYAALYERLTGLSLENKWFETMSENWDINNRYALLINEKDLKSTNSLIPINIKSVIEKDNINDDPEDDSYVVDSPEYYWCDPNNIHITGETGISSEIIYDNQSFSLNTNERSSAEINLSANGIQSTISSEEKDCVDFEYTFETLEGNVALDIKATSSNEKINISRTDSELVLYGLTDGDITLLKNGEVVDVEKVKDAVGKIEISYNLVTEDLEVLYHSHNFILSDTLSPSCINSGSNVYTCSCGESYTDTIEANGHTNSEWIIDSFSTCITEGSQHIECTVCEKTITTETIPVSAHIDNNSDSLCDNCRENLNPNSDNSTNCSHLCHKSGFMGFIWKILRFFYKLLGSNKICACGVTHY